MTDQRRLAARTALIDPFRVMEIAEEAWALAASGRSIIWLLAGEPDFGTPPEAVAAAHEASAGGRVQYTQSLGIPALREAISTYYGERFGLDVPVRRIAVTTGASGALSLALAATIDPGAQVLLTDPGYPCNRHFVHLYGGEPVCVPVGPDNAYQLDTALVDAHWNDRTSGLLLATPSNPTGTIVAPEELAAMADIVAARHGVLIVDEIYGELVYGRAPTTVLSHTDDAFVVNSFSKTFGMTGWRLGWLVVPEWAGDAIERLAQNLYIAAPAPSQAAGLACFQPSVWAQVDARRRELETRRDVLVDGLRSLGFAVPVIPDGAFYVYADCSPIADDAVAFVRRLLHDGGVACTPGLDFGTHRANAHIRFSYTASSAQLVTALERIATVIG